LSLVPCRKSIGIETLNRCSALSLDDLPGACKGKPVLAK